MTLAARTQARVASRWTRDRYKLDPRTLARRLIGQRLVRALPSGERLSGIIVETEAYLGAKDSTAHSYGGRRTPRNESMYAAPGVAYVYFTYGMHHCVNVVCGREGEPVAVLLRALAPEEGLERMRRSRRRAGAPETLRDTELCAGPARLCQALGIDRSLDGADLVQGEALWIEGLRTRAFPAARLRRTARIGVGSGDEWSDAPLRWVLADSPHTSRK